MYLKIGKKIKKYYDLGVKYWLTKFKKLTQNVREEIMEKQKTLLNYQTYQIFKKHHTIGS